MRFTTWFALETAWKVMMGLSLVLGWSARAETPLEPEPLAQGTLAERQQAAARRVLATGWGRSMVLSPSGDVWVWGTGSGATLGTWPEHKFGTGLPVRMPRMSGAVSLSTTTVNGHSLALLADGTVEAWGSNSYGQLGDGTVGGSRNTPAPVPGLSHVVAVAAGDKHSLALKRDGSVWAWGANHFSQLGDVTLNDSPLPVQVQGLQGVASIHAGDDVSVAVRTDGTVWTWGSDATLWDWDAEILPSPAAPAPGLSNVVKVSMVTAGLIALRSDGTARQWYLGGPDWPWAVFPHAPVENLTGAVDLVTGSNTLHILRADGTVWNFGGNSYGERGFPTEEPTSLELAQVPGLSGGVSLFSQGATVYALRADGTLMAWGRNHAGNLGNGVSPVQPRPARVLLPCKLKDLSTGEGVREQQCHAEP
jgi:alpha-tubulin suppressor-like RCC1 family protein